MTEAKAYYGDNLTSEQRSRTMRAVKSRDTTPEKALRSALRRLGVTGYRIDVGDVPGRPDVGFRKQQLAVFVDGGYWHGRPDRTRPGRSNYWDAKIKRNMERDRRNNLVLRERGWKVLRLWDDEVMKNPDAAALRVVRRLNARPMAEFFAGIGLVGFGLERAGFDVVLANDVDPVKKAIYESNHEASIFVAGDIRRLDGEDVPRIDLATASFPCTDLSLAGNRHGLNGDHSSTFWEFVRLLEEMGARKPIAVLIENVAGFVSSAGGNDLALAISGLNNLGYICDVIQLDARNWVAQSRVRTLIIGSQNEIANPQPWKPSEVRTAAICRFAADHRYLKLQAAPLPPLPKPTHRLREVVEKLDDSDTRWWVPERVTKFRESLSPLQFQRLESLVESADVTSRTAYRRTRSGRAVWEIRNDELSGCLRTARGGSSKQALVEAGGGRLRVRWMTSREYARLMGTPDADLSAVSENQALFGLGDAVCVPMIEWLGVHYLAPLVHGEFTESERELVTAAN